MLWDILGGFLTNTTRNVIQVRSKLKARSTNISEIRFGCFCHHFVPSKTCVDSKPRVNGLLFIFRRHDGTDGLDAVSSQVIQSDPTWIPDGPVMSRVTNRVTGMISDHTARSFHMDFSRAFPKVGVFFMWQFNERRSKLGGACTPSSWFLRYVQITLRTSSS